MEALLHYIWEYGLYFKSGLTTTDGQDVEVLHQGVRNTDGGPDFLNAVVRIGAMKWAGNIEIHQKASEWFKHKHDCDRAYDNVILHVVEKNDRDIFRNNGQKMATMELKYPASISLRYKELLNTVSWPACATHISELDPLVKNIWLTRLLIERMQDKSEFIRECLESCQYHYEETLYHILCRSMGFSLNVAPMDQLARALPLQLLLKYRHEQHQLEALFFGVAGFLDEDAVATEDEYFALLCREFKILKAKHHLEPMGVHLWQFLRLRPSNFPTVRLAQLSNLIYRSVALFSKLVEAKTLKDIRPLFECKASEYWDTHYAFGKPSTRRVKRLGDLAVDSILINTVLPFIFVYGKAQGVEAIEDKVIGFYEAIRPEKNRITSRWAALGWAADSAFDTQALIQLKKQYCEKKVCIRCKVAHHVLKCDAQK